MSLSKRDKCKKCESPTDRTEWGFCLKCANLAYQNFEWPYCRLISTPPPAYIAESVPEVSE